MSWFVLNRPLARLRLVGKLEAVSFLFLLGVAMPLKYLAGMPLAVRVAGMAHGLLFILLGILALQMMGERDWPFRRVMMVMGAALLPFGPFVIDKRLAEEEAREAAPSPAGEPSPAGD
jgi:integral membrane protein